MNSNSHSKGNRLCKTVKRKHFIRTLKDFFFFLTYKDPKALSAGHTYQGLREGRELYEGDSHPTGRRAKTGLWPPSRRASPPPLPTPALWAQNRVWRCQTGTADQSTWHNNALLWRREGSGKMSLTVALHALACLGRKERPPGASRYPGTLRKACLREGRKWIICEK